VSVEITYGLERLAMFIQKKDNVFDIDWMAGIKYGDLHLTGEREHSKYSFETAGVEALTLLFGICEKEAEAQVANKLVLPAYDYTLKCSHLFNLLDARGAISVSQRQAYIGRVRKLARECAKLYVMQREEMGYPLLGKK
jgi:glycyl-tRNA synthetase alpha chain